MEAKRLFIGGLFAGIGEADLKDRLGRFGDVSNVELKTRKGADGEPVKTFAHLDLVSTPDNFKKCVATYNGSKWKGSTLSIQVAKESFLDRLQKERVSVEQMDAAAAAPQVKTPKDIRVSGSKPGDPVPGEENWVVGKFGRALPVVHMRRKDGKKIMKVDPSKYTQGLKVLKDVQEEPADVDELTWEMDERNSEIEKKKMGLFPPMKKKKKKVVSSSVNADVLREVKDAEHSRLEEFEVVSRGRQKANDVTDDLDSDDTDEIIAMKRPMRDTEENSQGDLQTSDSSMEADDSDSGVEASGGRKGQKYLEKILHVSQETDEIILTSGPLGNELLRENGIVDNSGANSDSDASTDIDDILSRIQVKKKKTPKGKRETASASKTLESSDEEYGSVVKAKKRKLGMGVANVSSHVTPSSPGAGNMNDAGKKIVKKMKAAKKEKVRTMSEKSVAFDESDGDNLEEAEAFHEPKQGNSSWTKPVEKMNISQRDIVSFDDAGGVVDKLDDADDMDSTGSADTDELFSNMRKKLKTSDAKSQSTPKMSLPMKEKPTKPLGLNVSVIDEFASGLDDVAKRRLPSKQKSDSSDSESDESESNSDSDNGTKAVRGVGMKSLNSKGLAVAGTDVSVSHAKVAIKSGANSKIKNSSKIVPVSSDSDDEFLSCDSGSDSDSDSSPSDDKKTAGRSVSKAKTLSLKSDSDVSDSDDESFPSDSSSDSEDIQPSMSQVDGAKTKSSAPNEIESDSESDDSDSSDSDVQEKEITKSEVSNKKSHKKSASDSAVSVSSKFNTKDLKQQSDSDSSLDSSEAESDTSSEQTSGKESGNFKKVKAVSESEESSESEFSSDSELASDSEASSDEESGNLKSGTQGENGGILKVSAISCTGPSQQAENKDTGVQSKKEKKKNKDKTAKNVSKVDKHKSDDLKRMESFQQRRQESQSKINAIREALAAVDSGKTKGKKIVFSDSDSDDSAADESTHAVEKKSAPADPPKENIAKSKKKAPELFESDSEEDVEGVDDDEMFRIRPQFEGKAGKKLLRLQRRYGDDERFKMDEKFLESESDDEAEENVASQGDAEVERSERDRQMDVLKDMFGSRAVDKKVAKKPTFQNTSSVHFDPTREDHSQFEVHVEPKKTEKEKKKKKKADEAEKMTEPELPEVSKERFYEVSTDLKDIFQGKAETSTFSFLTPDPEEGNESVEKLASPEPEACQPSSLLPWQAETFNYDTSSGEEEEEERMETKQTEVEPQTEPVNAKQFFFSLDDARIKEGVESFYRKEDMSVIRQDWWEKRPSLIDSYRMRRKRALRKQRHDKVNVPPHKKAKGKWK